MKITLDNIYYYYNGKRVVEAFSYTYSDNGMYIITGDNGSGKTTLLKLISGILQPQRGIIKTINIQNIGFVCENAVLWENFTVKEQLKMMENLYSLNTRVELERVIDSLGLNHYRDIQAKNLSNGNRSKLNFILSILHQPELLIIDEVFSALDLISVDIILRYLQSYSHKNIVIMSTNRREIIEMNFNKEIIVKETL